MKVLITTTINVPNNLREWRRAGFNSEDVFIVAGDTNSPGTEIENFLKTLPGDNRYLPPVEQEIWTCSDVIGWRTIQRRNIALLEAMKLKPDWILTVDDDNYPIDRGHAYLIDDILRNSENINETFSTISSSSGWFNVGNMLRPVCVHRGYPLSQRLNTPKLTAYKRSEEIGVVASLWLGDPDIDAIQRLNSDVHIEECHGPNLVLERGTWCPFNSQATAHLAELAPLMSVWPGVGRYDDIWSSYMARAVMDAGDYRVCYGEPLVRQTRNHHSYFDDLQEELHGLEHTEDFCAVLRSFAEPSLEVCFNELKHCSFIPSVTKDFFAAWLEDVKKVNV